MESTKLQPVARPRRYSTTKLTLGFMILSLAAVGLGTAVIISFLNAHDVAEMLEADPYASFAPKGSPYNTPVLLAILIALIATGAFLVAGGAEGNDEIWKYVIYLETKLNEDAAAHEAKYKALDAETLNYRLALRAAVIRADRTLIDELVARELGGTTPPADDKPAS